MWVPWPAIQYPEPATEPPPEAPGTLCPRHEGEWASQICSRCGDYICARCEEASGGHPYCPDCRERVQLAGDLPSGTRWDVGAVLGRSFSLLAAVIVPGLLLEVVPQALGLALNLAAVQPVIWWRLGRSGWGTGGGVLLGLLVLVVTIWLTFRVQAALILLMRDRLYGTTVPGAWRAFASAGGFALPLFLVALVKGVALGGIMLACIPLFFLHPTLGLLGVAGFGVVALRVALGWCITAPLVTLERSSPWDALGRSWELVRGCGWQSLGIWVVAGLVVTGISIPSGVLGLATGPRGPGSAVTGVVVLYAVQALTSSLTSIFTMAVVVSIYYGLRSRLRSGRRSHRRVRPTLRPPPGVIGTARPPLRPPPVSPPTE